MPPFQDASSATGAAKREMLRFLVCGSAGDGRSALIGRLLLDGSPASHGQLSATEEDSKVHGTVERNLDGRHLHDGPEAQRKRGIPLDVSYQHFATRRRGFIVAVNPRQTQYTRNMVAGASTSDLAVLLVDAQKGLLEQTRRQAFICALFGIRDLVLAVNKMDLVGFRREQFASIADAFADFAKQLNIRDVLAIPLSAQFGDNVVRRSGRTPWYDGPPLLDYLEMVDVSRGDVISAADRPPQLADAFAAHLVWMAEAPLLPGREYLLECGARTVNATVTELKHRIDVSTFANIAAKVLRLNEIAFVNIATQEPIAVDVFNENRDAGSFILIDRATNATVAIGMIRFVLYRSNLHWQPFDVTKRSRSALNHQKPIILWFTGLSGAGKSTIANLLERKLHALGKHTYLLDGDNVRHGLNRDLGFTEGDRVENIRRVAELAKLFVDAGVITLVAFISPFRAEREMARQLVEDDEFVEIFVDAPLEVCRRRDPKGLYGKAERGELRNFTGIDSPYEPPEHPELRLDTSVNDAEPLAEQILQFLRQRGVLG
jgi:bifunctional enzyme CysN/CysC